MVVIDDLHWADQSSIDELDLLVAGVEDHRLITVATYRSVDPMFGEALTTLLSRLTPRAGVRRLRLTGLDKDDLAQLLSSAGASPTDDLLSTMEERTRGNPFFVTEILRLVPSESGAPDARTIEHIMPSNVKEVILRRVNRLPDVTAEALLTASVLGHEFDLGLLALIVGVDDATLLDRLEPAEMAGLIVENRAAFGRFWCSRTGWSARRCMTTWVSHGEPAAMWSLGYVAHTQAEEQLQWALELVGTMPAGAPRADLELEILDQISLVLIVTTSYSGLGIAVAAARARELCDEIGDPGRLVPALWRLATHHMMRGQIRAGIAVGNELIDRGSADGGLPAATLAGHMGLGILLTQLGDIVEARRHLDIAIEMCDAGFDAPLIGLVIEEPAVFSRVFSSINMWLRGDEAAAEQQASRAVEIGMRDGPQWYSATLSLWGASTVSMLRGDVAATIKQSDEGTHQAVTYGYPLAINVFGVTHGWAIAALGNPTAGAQEIRTYADGFFAVGALYLRPFYQAVHAEACLMGSDVDEAHRSIDDGLSVSAETGEAWFDAELHRLRGEALAAADPGDPMAIASVRRAIEIAASQGSDGLRGRAESSLARLLSN